MEIIKKLFMLETKMALGMIAFMAIGITFIALTDKELYQEIKGYFIKSWYIEMMPALVRWCYKNTR